MSGSLNNRVGIIIPTINRTVLFERALISVFNQSFRDWCLVVVNDGGDKYEIEETVNILKKKYNCENQVLLLSNIQSLGKAVACNYALSLLETQFVIILNDDDSWAYEFLTMAVSQLEYRNSLHKNIRGIIALANIMHEEVMDDHVYIKWCTVPSEKDLQPFNNHIHLHELATTNIFSSSQFLFYKSCIAQTGYLNEELLILNDWEFHIRFACSFSIFIITQPFVNIHQRFYSTNDVYLNWRSVHENKLAYYNERMSDILLRQKPNQAGDALNQNSQFQLQMILFLRLQKQQSGKSGSPESNSPSAYGFNNQLTEIIEKMNHLESESKRVNDWFKYIEYKLKPSYIRKGTKLIKLINYGITSKNKRSGLKQLFISFHENGIWVTLKNLVNKENNEQTG